MANADGKDPVRLTDFGSAPSWSPDESKLAFHAGVLAEAVRVFDVCAFSPPESYQWVAMALSDGGHSLRHIFARLSSRVGGPGIGLAAATILSVRWSTPVIHLRRNKRYHLCRAWPAARPPPDSLPHGLGVTRAIGGAEPIRDRRLPSIYSLPQQR